PYCFEVSNSPGQTAVKSLIGTAFGVDRGVGRLVENAPHVAIAFGRTVASGDFGALFPAWTTPNPRGHLARRRKRGGMRTHFSDDLLGRIRSQTRHLRQPVDRILV